MMDLKSSSEWQTIATYKERDNVGHSGASQRRQRTPRLPRNSVEKRYELTVINFPTSPRSLPSRRMQWSDSDFSDLDSPQRTDYTYARSPSYRASRAELDVPSPKMHRRSLAVRSTESNNSVVAAQNYVNASRPSAVRTEQARAYGSSYHSAVSDSRYRTCYRSSAVEETTMQNQLKAQQQTETKKGKEKARHQRNQNLCTFLLLPLLFLLAAMIYNRSFLKECFDSWYFSVFAGREKLKRDVPFVGEQRPVLDHSLVIDRTVVGEVNQTALLLQLSSLEAAYQDLIRRSGLGQSELDHLKDEQRCAIGEMGMMRKALMDLSSRYAMLQARLDSVSSDCAKNHQMLTNYQHMFDSARRQRCYCRPHGGCDQSQIYEYIDRILAKYTADKTGMADYALESAGGSILSTRCTETYNTRTRVESVFGIPFWYMSYSPRTVIQPRLNPGECWAFRGYTGSLIIQLSRVINITGFSYEHIPVALSPDGNIDSAPRRFSVYGLHSANDRKGYLLGTYDYSVNGTPLQYFAVERSNAPPFSIVELKVKSNQGHPMYTCLYRFRVHGNRVRPT